MVLGQFLGTWSGAVLMLIGVFSENQGALHMLASRIFFVLNFVVLILVGLAVVIHGRLGVASGLYRASISLSSLFLAILVGGPIVKWYTVPASLGFVGLISFLTYRLLQASQEAGPETRL